jgi:hypothetical protein
MALGARAPLCVALILLDALAGSVSSAAELQPQTAAAFDRYVRASEQRIAEEVEDPARFLWLDTQTQAARENQLAALRRGELVIERLTTRDGGRAIDVPDGLVHHWLGVVFVPGATLERAVRLLQAYDRHAQIYHPAVADSRLVSRSGERFRLFLRFQMTKVITVVVNSDHEAQFTQPAPNRVYSRIVSTRIAEVEDPGTSREREKPVGQDGGYLWRLNSYWRFLERDGGTYLQCESISLTRGIPLGFGWLVGPFVTSIPRESLTFTLETTRKVLASPAAAGF